MIYLVVPDAIDDRRSFQAMDELDDDVPDSDIDGVKFQCVQDLRRLRDVQAELQGSDPVSLGTAPDGDHVDPENEASSSRLQLLHELEKR